MLGQARSKSVLLDAAKSETRYLNKLHQLGILLGITEWVKDFHTKHILPPPPEMPSQVREKCSITLNQLLVGCGSMMLLNYYGSVGV